MPTLPQLIEEDIQLIEEVLGELLEKSEATTALLIDKGGFLSRAWETPASST